VGRRRREATTLGIAVQLGIVRFLGTFLDDPVVCPPFATTWKAWDSG